MVARQERGTAAPAQHGRRTPSAGRGGRCTRPRGRGERGWDRRTSAGSASVAMAPGTAPVRAQAGRRVALPGHARHGVETVTAGGPELARSSRPAGSNRHAARRPRCPSPARRRGTAGPPGPGWSHPRRRGGRRSPARWRAGARPRHRAGRTRGPRLTRHRSEVRRRCAARDLPGSHDSRRISTHPSVPARLHHRPGPDVPEGLVTRPGATGPGRGVSAGPGPPGRHAHRSAPRPPSARASVSRSPYRPSGSGRPARAAHGRSS